MAYNNVEKLLRECTNPETYNFEFECDYGDYKALSPMERYLVYKSTGEGQKISDDFVYKHKDVKYYYRSALFSLDNYWRYPKLVDCDGWDEECSLAVSYIRRSGTGSRTVRSMGRVSLANWKGWGLLVGILLIPCRLP